MLVEELIAEINNASSTQVNYKSKNISDKGMKCILTQPWPGNIRELWNTLNRAFLWSSSAEVSDKDILDAMLVRDKTQEDAEVALSLGQVVDINQIIDKHKKKYVLAALKTTGNNLTKTSAMLSLNSHQTLKGWIKSLDINLPK